MKYCSTTGLIIWQYHIYNWLRHPFWHLFNRIDFKYSVFWNQSDCNTSWLKTKSPDVIHTGVFFALTEGLGGGFGGWLSLLHSAQPPIPLLDPDHPVDFFFLMCRLVWGTPFFILILRVLFMNSSCLVQNRTVDRILHCCFLDWQSLSLGSLFAGTEIFITRLARDR